ncbi:MAG: tetraacyldisaccharide 4'-kinase [bacterium]
MLEQIYRKILRRRGLSLWQLAAFGAWLLSFGYRLGYYLARLLPIRSVKVPVPVISVGNVTVGGTGKTPTVACLASHLVDDGIRVGIVSSGYGRANKKASFVCPGYQVQEMPTADTGDEVKLLSHLLPQAVFSVAAAKSEATVRLTSAIEVDVILVDDGFQHRRLYRDIDLVTFDLAVPDRMLKWFPLGLLREPLSALKRADMIIGTRSNFARDLSLQRDRLRRLSPQAELYSAQFLTTELVGPADRRPLKYLEDKSVFLFAGIGNFKPLRHQVAALCADLDQALELSDHQRYDQALLERIQVMVARHDSDVILTTGKDWVKLPDFAFDREIYYLGQTIDLDPGEETLLRSLKQHLDLHRQER